ncbi:MAG: iron-containing alcohol dehydrogenase [Clostridiales bacterium]|nr:iron-containing alcohol dehydrogenase [Clostridiales bacterium]
MRFDFYMPVKVISGEDCIRKNMTWLSIGKKCLIVTGRRSAVASGALTDVAYVLEELGIEYKLFDRVIENPPLSICYEGGREAHSFGADFVIGIGGGSPLDAAKAIAAFAANPGVPPMALYDEELAPALPIVAVPTTAGTGSEVNQYSVITLDESNKKRTLSSAHIYPKVAFLDQRYIATQSEEGMLSTTLDAFCHCFESYLSPRANTFTCSLAAEGATVLWKALVKGVFKDHSRNTCAELLYASTLGGIVIGMTGTGFPHPMGYPLTLKRGLPHGRACAAFYEEYIAYNQKNEEGRGKINALCEKLGSSPREVGARIFALSSHGIKLSEAEADAYIDDIRNAKNYANSPYVLSFEEIKAIYRKLFVNA